MTKNNAIKLGATIMNASVRTMGSPDYRSQIIRNTCYTALCDVWAIVFDSKTKEMFDWSFSAYHEQCVRAASKGL
jgi:hypothetical protein